MSLIGNLSNSSQPRLSSGEPPLKKLRKEKEEMVDGVRNQSLSPSSTTALDRFLPNRLAMNQALIADTYFMKPPKTAYTQALMQAIAPYYSSSKSLLNQTPETFQTFCEPKPVWKIPNKAWSTERVSEMSENSSNDFYKHPLDWGRHIYLAIDSSLYKVGPLKRDICWIKSFYCDTVITSIKSSPSLDEVAIGDKRYTLCLFDLQAEQVSLSYLVNSICGRMVYCIAWKKEGSEFTMGLNNAIVHFDKRQKREAWALSLEPDHNNCSIDWNKSDVFLGTGNNTNLLRIFDARKVQDRMQKAEPVYKLATKAGIKALQWNPNNPELLAIGAGTADKHLYLIDLKEMKNNCKKNVGFQICDLTWLDREHLVIGAGFSSDDSEKLSVWHYRKAIQSIKRIGVMAGLSNSRALNLAKDPRSTNICSQYSSIIESTQEIQIWKIENIEQTEALERKRSRKLSSMNSWDVR